MCYWRFLKKLGFKYEVENQPLYDHGVVPNGDPQGSEKSSVVMFNIN